MIFALDFTRGGAALQASQSHLSGGSHAVGGQIPGRSPQQLGTQMGQMNQMFDTVNTVLLKEMEIKFNIVNNMR